MEQCAKVTKDCLETFGYGDLFSSVDGRGKVKVKVEDEVEGAVGNAWWKQTSGRPGD